MAQKHWAEDASATLAKGVLEAPAAFYRQEVMTCEAACLRMIFRSITGSVLNEDEVVRNMRKVFNGYAQQEELARIFRTTAFKEAYGIPIETIHFTGMSLLKLSEICTKLKASGKKRKLHCVLSVGSDSSTDGNLWHAVVLTGANADTVFFNDPDPNLPNQQSKHQFLERWAVTYNSGYLAIANS